MAPGRAPNALRATAARVAELIEDDEVGVNEPAGDLTGLSLRLFLLEGIDERDGGEERRTVAQSAGCALDDCQIMPPVMDAPAQSVVRASEYPWMRADRRPLGDDNNPVGIHPQADRAAYSGRSEASSGRTSLMSVPAAQAPMSWRRRTAAIMSGKRSGVQVKTGMSKAATALAMAGS